ncbi:hypothetical protein [Nocardia farcinica]|uniref:hypothetical protein n=1 Tax=Nocardia farcinica TaxID=37329 RepID=UPI0024577A11|nr:hypothetical protein [Nocardia farcinica]
MKTERISFAKLNLADDLKPAVPHGDDALVATAILNHALERVRVFDDQLRRFLNPRVDIAPVAATYAWEFDAGVNALLLEWVRQWPTSSDVVEPDEVVGRSEVATVFLGLAGAGPGPAVPDGDDPETVRDIVQFVVRRVGLLRTEIRNHANVRYEAAPASGEHAFNLTSSMLRLVAHWAMDWPTA